jgi:hypothetical protein
MNPQVEDVADARAVLETAAALGMPIPSPVGSVFFRASLEPDRFETLVSRPHLLGYFPTYDAALTAAYVKALALLDVRRGYYTDAPWIISAGEDVRQQLRQAREERWPVERLEQFVQPLREAWLNRYSTKGEVLDAIAQDLYSIVECRVIGH